MKKLICAFALLLVCISAPILAQDRNSLRDRVVASIKKNEDKWKLEQDHVLEGTTIVVLDVVGLEWEFDKARAASMIYLYPTSEEAIKDYPNAFRGYPDCLVQQTVLETRIFNLGDENYVWEDRKIPPPE